MEGPEEPPRDRKMEVDYLQDKFDEIKTKRIRLPRQAVQSVQRRKQCAKEKKAALKKQVSQILLKPETEHTFEEAKILKSSSKIVKEINLKRRKREEAKRRLEEFEDAEDILDQKCQILAQAIAQSQHLVVYTGAGISTAAKIPDYRGPDGIWTRLKEGRDIGDHDLSLAEPTYTHMALYELYHQRILKYVVSQNCDGLHLRSGLPKTALSELHGNMYVEVCKDCKPPREYWRLFDVTESTARYSHKTYRRCYMCNGPLMDTIVHFGERGSLQWPLNWKGACKNAKDATTILCIGSSLKVLKKYPWLWQMDKPLKKRPNLYIINLQWTPKDECANVKVNGKCDVVFKKIMNILGISVPKYDKSKDPIFYHATDLNELESHTTTRLSLSFGKGFDNGCEEGSKVDCKKDDIDSFGNHSKKETSVACKQDVSGSDDSDCKNSSDNDECKEATSIDCKLDVNNFANDVCREETSLESLSGSYKKEANIDSAESNSLVLENGCNGESSNCEFEDIKMEGCLYKDKEYFSEFKKVFNKNQSGPSNIEGFKDVVKPDGSPYKNQNNCLSLENDYKKDMESQEEGNSSIFNNGDDTNLCKVEVNSSSQSSQDETMSETNSNKDCSISDKPDLDDLNCDTNSSNSSSSPEEQNFIPDSTQIMETFLRNGIRPPQFNQLLDPTLSLLSYNLLHSQVFGAYTNFLLYPYQTSFLYPGLHSIINPLPVIKEEMTTKCEVKEEEIDPQCEFCHKNYKSSVCGFYEKLEPVFKKEILRYSKIEKKDKPNICECCDYTTEEEDGTEDNNTSEKDRQTDSMEASGSEQKTKVQPGWFGKGYRKGRRLKRKLL